MAGLMFQQVEEAMVAVVLLLLLLNDDYYYYSFLYFHSNDSMIDFHRTEAVVERNYFDMTNDCCCMMIVHNVMASNHIDEVHVTNYHDHDHDLVLDLDLDHDDNYFDSLMMNHRLNRDTIVDYLSYDVDYDHNRMLCPYLSSQLCCLADRISMI